MLDYCKAGVTPGYENARVINAKTGEEYKYVIEADASEGWLIRVILDSAGKFMHDGQNTLTEKVVAAIRIECGGNNA